MCYPIFESRGFSQGRGGSVKGKAKEEKSLTPGGGRVESGSSPLDFLLVSMRPRGTPVPIPNTMVKTRPAENTTLVTMWEDKWMPDFWGCSSVGRAPALQAGGQGFESLHLHWTL